MKKLLIASVATVTLALANISPALAWHPVIKVSKQVQNVTAGGSLKEADDAANAVAAKPGDVLKYVIEVSNVGTPDQSGNNDLYYTVLTDNLPTGVELVANASQRKISENIGVLKPGQKVAKEYQVKVTSTTDGAVITNEACGDGNSKVNDNKQHKCDVAVVKVNVPPKQDEPKKEVLSATTIPATGPETVVASALGLGSLGYGVNAYIRSRQAVTRANKR